MYVLLGARLLECARVDALQEVRGAIPLAVTRSISRFVNLSSVDLTVQVSGLSAFSSKVRSSLSSASLSSLL